MTFVSDAPTVPPHSTTPPHPFPPIHYSCGRAACFISLRAIAGNRQPARGGHPRCHRLLKLRLQRQHGAHHQVADALRHQPGGDAHGGPNHGDQPKTPHRPRAQQQGACPLHSTIYRLHYLSVYSVLSSISISRLSVLCVCFQCSRFCFSWLLVQFSISSTWLFDLSWFSFYSIFFTFIVRITVSFHFRPHLVNIKPPVIGSAGFIVVDVCTADYCCFRVSRAQQHSIRLCSKPYTKMIFSVFCV